MTVALDTLTKAFTELGIPGSADVAVHSSLSSFGRVSGGAETIVTALARTFTTVLVPTFSELGRTYPPGNDHPEQNGTDYEKYKPAPGEKPGPPFNEEEFDVNSNVDEEIGVVPRVLLSQVGAMRSKHPSCSWGAVGSHRNYYLQDHATSDPMLPLKRLAENSGHILLLGVGLTRCTAMHLAEELTGRRPFIRWIQHADGSVKRTYEFGCSLGFDNLLGDVAAIEKSLTIGKCLVRAYSLKPFIRRVTKAIERNPQITACPRMCSRCRDSIKGGPHG